MLYFFMFISLLSVSLSVENVVCILMYPDRERHIKAYV